ncbi:MAG TPA: hypothetical protein VKX17_01335 [Planctomycetota bacterium]|nr:hypothetical protein [Planctomycetota bacterium]
MKRKFLKNFNRIIPAKCKCASWLEHWKKFSRQPVAICCAELCAGTATAAAFGQRRTDNVLVVVPVCEKHARVKSDRFPMYTGVKAVPVDMRVTCGAAKPESQGSEVRSQKKTE